MRAWVAVAVVGVLLVSGCKHRGSAAGASAVGEPASRVGEDRARVANEQAALLNLETTEMNTDVPAGVQHALPPFKDALVRLADAVMAGEPASADAKGVEQALRAALPSEKSAKDAHTDMDAEAKAKAAGKNEFEVPEKGDYGGALTAAVSQASPGVLLVDVGFGVMCGEDHVLLGYSGASGRWKRVLRWQAAPYDKVSGAFGDIFEAMPLQPQRNGHTVLLVVHGTPWCTSTMSAFAMDTFEIDPSGETEKPFWHAEHDYRRADDGPRLGFRLKGTADGFEARASVSDSLGDDVNRLGVMRYALVDGKMQRVEPIAMNSRESVAEWLEMPRDEAERFTDAPAGSGLWRMWEALTYRGKSEDEAMRRPMLSYGEVRACAEPKHFQVEIASEVYTADNKTHAPGSSYFVQVHEAGNGYRLDDARTEANPACHGPVIPLQSSGYASEPGSGQ